MVAIKGAAMVVSWRRATLIRANRDMAGWFLGHKWNQRQLGQGLTPMQYLTSTIAGIKAAPSRQFAGKSPAHRKSVAGDLPAVIGWSEKNENNKKQ